jgi:nicotinate-nucleotide adenylyltransferase
VAARDRRSAGILGGTFNPPHLGHLAAARHARAELGLDEVVLMPAHAAPHKTGDPDPGPERRLAMCRLLVAGEDGLSTCAAEVERGGASYTVDTLRAIHAGHPHAELTFIVGADTAATLPSWREPDALLDLAELAVVTRRGSAEDAVRDRLRDLLAGHPRRVRFLSMPAVEVSSSAARERAEAGATAAELEGIVGAAVARYIAEHRLYVGAEAQA